MDIRTNCSKDLIKKKKKLICCLSLDIIQMNRRCGQIIISLFLQYVLLDVIRSGRTFQKPTLAVRNAVSHKSFGVFVGDVST